MSTLSLDNITLPKTMSLTYVKSKRDWVESEDEAPIKIIDNKIVCLGDLENSVLWFDYYGEFRGESMWINEKLEAWAKANFGKNAYWEWENISLLSLCID